MAKARKRTVKRLKNTCQGDGNLSAYLPLRTSSSPRKNLIKPGLDSRVLEERPLAAMASMPDSQPQVLSTPTLALVRGAQLPTAKEESAKVTAGFNRRKNDAAVNAASHESSDPCNDPANESQTETDIPTEKNTPSSALGFRIAAAAGVVLAIVAVTDSFWASKELTEDSRTAANNQPNQGGASELSPETMPQAVSRQIPDAWQTGLRMDDLVQEIHTTRKRVSGYQEEMSWLNVKNASLRQQVDVLNNETTALNREILDVELNLVAAESALQPRIETRTVFNFVNVPIGNSLGQPGNSSVSRNNTAQAEAVNSVDDKFIDGRDRYLGEDEAMDAYAESQFYVDESGGPVQLEDQLFYDPDTGYYLAPSEGANERVIIGQDAGAWLERKELPAK